MKAMRPHVPGLHCFHDNWYWTCSDLNAVAMHPIPPSVVAEQLVLLLQQGVIMLMDDEVHINLYAQPLHSQADPGVPCLATDPIVLCQKRVRSWS